MSLGQDANWDLRNYHLYIGYTALHGRAPGDLAAAGLQSWLNPALDIPYTWLALGPLARHPIVLAAVMGLWYGALIAVALALAVALYRDWPGPRKWIAIAAATVIGVSGAAAVSQVGTTFNDIQVGMLVLLALLLLARALQTGIAVSLNVIVAGALLGCAAGLKFTEAIYIPAALAALAAATTPARRWRHGISLAAGALAGFAISGGWWCWTLWQRYGNPLFPFFNGVFRSPWYPPQNFFDRRFLPHGVWQILFYPFYWFSDQPFLVTEPPFRDGRMAAALACAIIAALFVIFRRAGARENRIAPAQRLILVFVLAAYLSWLGTTSILRYAIPVEVCAGLSLPLLLLCILNGAKNRRRTAMWGASVAVLSAALLGSTHYPDWPRIAYRRPVVAANLGWLPAHSLVVLAGGTMSYIVPFAPSGTEFLGLTDAVYQSRGYRLAEVVRRRIAAHKGPIFAVWNTGGNWRIRAMHDMGLVPIAGMCRTFFASYEFNGADRLNACRARAMPQTLHSPFWKIAAVRYRTVEVPRRDPLWSYASFAQAAGHWIRGKHFIDEFDYLWAQPYSAPAAFRAHFLPNTLYVLAPELRQRALAGMDRSRDLLAEIDGLLVLAPGWIRCRSCTRVGAHTRALVLRQAEDEGLGIRPPGELAEPRQAPIRKSASR